MSTPTMTANQMAARNKRTPRFRVLLSAGKMTWFQKEASALARARKIAVEEDRNVTLVDCFLDERHIITPTGNVIDGHSRRVTAAPKAHTSKDIAGRPTVDQHRVNRSYVLVAGSRCKVQGERGRVFVFDALVTNGTSTWAECREIERLPNGVDVTAKMRAFRPERLRTAPGWNNSQAVAGA
jgi:hypothetical protein